MQDNNNKTIQIGQLTVAPALFDFVQNELTPDSGVSVDQFWFSLEGIVAELGSKNTALLDKRDQLQAQIDAWHEQHAHTCHDHQAYKAFLQSIGYLLPTPESVSVDTQNVDEEVTYIAGPQLVVPLDNARYALNAVNARWGSLYDALYGTDAIPQDNGCEKTQKYNPIRGDRVIDFCRDFLNRHFGLEQGSHARAVRYSVVDEQLAVTMGNGQVTSLLRPERFVGYIGDPQKPDSVLFCNNDLHVEIRFGEGYFIGRRDHANIYDIQIESAISAIMDCEDSVAAIDVEDKLLVYRNWLGLMQGSLSVSFRKNNAIVNREMNTDRQYLTSDGRPMTLRGRALLLVRNVGAHLKTNMVNYNGEPIYETMLDCMVTALAGKRDLLKQGKYVNSRAGSIYIVKPKMHGPEEVALASRLFGRVEKALALPGGTLKMGIMDEERRTSVNLVACLAEAASRVFFINTGFLDRTGDEIHTSMKAGPMLPKQEMKSALWLRAYEKYNVDIGLRCGLVGHAQIGKGMWAAPDEMAAMMESKIAHPKSGANTAWVPSPTVATLHALHYHLIEVKARQTDLLKRKEACVDDILSIPLLPPERQLSDQQKQQELENNIQGLLGYVSRWVGQGIGCSKVMDIDNVDLMEDCATLRISSQAIANWFYHGIYTEEQVCKTMKKMAYLIDAQNQNDANYQPMAGRFEHSVRFKAALDLVFKAREQPNGYTEYILQECRRQVKARERAQ